MRFKDILIITFFILATSCAGPKMYIKDNNLKINKPQSLILSIQSVGEDWSEDFRMAFEKLGYEIVLEDEVKVSTVTSKGHKKDTERLVLDGESKLRYELKLRYSTKWDVVNYVDFYSVRFMDLSTRKTLGSRSNRFTWAHPGAESIAEEIDKELLQKLYR